MRCAISPERRPSAAPERKGRSAAADAAFPIKDLTWRSATAPARRRRSFARGDRAFVSRRQCVRRGLRQVKMARRLRGDTARARRQTRAGPARCVCGPFARTTNESGEKSMNFRMMSIALAIALLGACRSAPIYNVNDAPVVVTAGKAATAEQVKTAILRAGGRLGWQMTESQPGVVTARISLRGHSATADVKYNAKAYSIVYRESSNLKAESDQIHKNYNGWIENLDREIRNELLRI
jgi:hypothetical protein